MPQSSKNSDGGSAKDKGNSGKEEGELPKRFTMKSQGATVRNMSNKLEFDEDSFRKRVKDLVETSRFDLIFGLVVFFNAIFMGVEMQMSDEHQKKNYYVIVTFDMIFLVLFIIELGMRIIAWGWKACLTNSAVLLDFIIVVVGIFSEFIGPLAANTFYKPPEEETDEEGGGAEDSVGAIKLLKTLRTLRAIRVLRMLTIFEDLWNVVQIFFFSLKPLFWMVVFIFLILFIFAMFAISLFGKGGVPDDIARLPEDDDDRVAFEEAQAQFSTTALSMLALLQIMTFDDGMQIMYPILEQYPLTAYPWFLLYMPISAFVLMNMVTALVYENAHVRAVQGDFHDDIQTRMRELGEIYMQLMNPKDDAKDRELNADKKLKDGEHKMGDMDSEEDAGDDEEGFSKEDFVRNCKKCKPMMDVLDTMGMSEQDLEMLFDIMDQDGSQKIDFYEFADCYMRLKNLAQDAASVALLQCSERTADRKPYMERVLLRGSEIHVLVDIKKILVDLVENMNYNTGQLARLTHKMTLFEDHSARRTETLLAKLRGT